MVKPRKAALRASDRDREAALDLLREAAVDGRLTVEELAERAERTEGARTHGELAAITGDLGPLRGAVAASGPLARGELVDRHRAVLSSMRRNGRWQLAPRSRFAATLGSIELDLRQAVLPGPEVEIEVVARLGSVRVLLPEGVDLHVTGRVAAGSCTVHSGSDELPLGAPVVRVHAAGALGSVDVRSCPRVVDRLKAGMRRFANDLLSSPPPGAGGP